MTKKKVNKVQISITPQSVFLVIGILLFIALLFKLTVVLYIFFISFSIYSSLKPIITKLEKKFNIHRSISIPLILVSFVILITFLVGLVVQNISLEVKNIDFNQLTENFVDVVEENLPFLQITDTDTTITGGESTQVNGSTTATSSNFFRDSIFNGGGTLIIQFLSNTAGILFSLFTVFVVAYYMLLKKGSIFEGMLKFIPNRDTRKTLRRYINKVEGKLGSWLMSQFTLMLIIGVMSYIGVILPDLFFEASDYRIGRFAVTLAVISGILEVVPNIGPIVSFLCAIFLSIALGGDYVLAQTIYVGFLFFIIQQIEAAFIVPRIMKKAIGLDPIVTVLGVIAGGTLGGAIGAVLIIPVIATIQILIEFLVHEEELFGQEKAHVH